MLCYIFTVYNGRACHLIFLACCFWLHFNPKGGNPDQTLLFLLWHSTEAVAFFHSPSSPLFSLLALLSCLVSIERLSLHCSPNWKLWIWSTGLSTQLTPSSRREAWVRGNLTALTERSQLATRWTRVADRVSSGSFRGGHWRYLPIRNHDNRSSADWIRLCPGLSKNSENGNSCPKPHKAARHDWSSGKSGQHWDWDY